MSHFIDFVWWRDPERGFVLRSVTRSKGRWVYRELTPPYSEHEGERLSVFWKGAKLQQYRPLEQHSDLAVIYSKVRTAEDALNFVNTFGMIDQSGAESGQGESVSGILSDAQLIRDLLTLYATGGRRAVFEELTAEGAIFDFPISASLVPEPNSRSVRLKYKIFNLRSAILLQLGLTLAGGAAVRVCRRCQTPFTAGPGTQRRLDAKFCSDQHRIEFNSLNRSKGE